PIPRFARPVKYTRAERNVVTWIPWPIHICITSWFESSRSTNHTWFEPPRVGLTREYRGAVSRYRRLYLRRGLRRSLLTREDLRTRREPRRRGKRGRRCCLDDEDLPASRTLRVEHPHRLAAPLARDEWVRVVVRSRQNTRSRIPRPRYSETRIVVSHSARYHRDIHERGSHRSDRRRDRVADGTRVPSDLGHHRFGRRGRRTRLLLHLEREHLLEVLVERELDERVLLEPCPHRGQVEPLGDLGDIGRGRDECAVDLGRHGDLPHLHRVVVELRVALAGLLVVLDADDVRVSLRVAPRPLRVGRAASLLDRLRDHREHLRAEVLPGKHDARAGRDVGVVDDRERVLLLRLSVRLDRRLVARLVDRPTPLRRRVPRVTPCDLRRALHWVRALRAGDLRELLRRELLPGEEPCKSPDVVEARGALVGRVELEERLTPVELPRPDELDQVLLHDADRADLRRDLPHLRVV